MKQYLIGPQGFATFEEAFDAAKKELQPDEAAEFLIRGEVKMKKTLVIRPDDLFNGRDITFRGDTHTEASRTPAVINGAIRVDNFVPVQSGTNAYDPEMFRTDACDPEIFRTDAYRQEADRSEADIPESVRAHSDLQLYCASLPEIEHTRTLYLDGKFAERPGTEEVSAFGWDHAAGDWDFYKENGEIVGLVGTDRTILGWRNHREIEMIFNVGWTHHILPIESVSELDDGRVIIRPLAHAFALSREMVGVAIGGCPTRFENVFEEMKKPGEWYFDPARRELYLLLEKGDHPANHVVEIPMTDYLIRIEGSFPEGTIRQKIKNIRFEDLTFRGTTFLRPLLYGHSDLQAGFLRPGSEQGMPLQSKPFELDACKLPGTVRILAGEHIDFERCRFTCLSSTALSYEFGAAHCRVNECTFEELGAGALLVGDVDGIRSHHPEDPQEEVVDITLENSRIHHTGRDFFSTVAVLLGYVAECSVTRNEISDVPYSAISVGWGWGSTDVAVGPYRPTEWTTPTVSRKHNISFNHIYRCVMKLYDGGAIYTLGAMEGTVIEGNVIHNTGGYEGEGCPTLSVGGYQSEGLGYADSKPFQDKGPFPGGIYLDEGSRGIEVKNNVLWGVTVPLFYHNQIDEGYRRVSFHDNVLNEKRPI